MNLRLTVAALLAVLPLPGAAQSQRRPFLRAETGQAFASLQAAVDSIGDGVGEIRVAPGTYRECAVQLGADVTLVAEVPGQTLFDGGICEDKATYVSRGRSTAVHGIIFQNQRVADGNGAGIRLERGNLVVTQSWFRDAEQGILTAPDLAGNVTVEKSTFTRLGRCDRGLACAHSIYVGDYGSLTVRRSRFEEGRGGHYLKSRATRVEITDNSFDDARGIATNYMVDLSIGGTGLVARNWMVQGQDKENWSAFIAIGAEGPWKTANGLTIRDNDARFAPGFSRSSAFVADWTGHALVIGENALGPGVRRFERR
jgi:hypothetical protein